MNSIVVHYKELALKGRNRPWFVQMLVRNLRDARWRASACGDPVGDGPHRDRARRRRRRGTRSASASAACSASRTSRTRAGPRTTSRPGGGILGDLGDRHAASFRVSARRSDKRFPLTSPEIEREVGGLIKQAHGLAGGPRHAALDHSHRDAAGPRVLLFREGAGRRRPADRHRRPRRVPAVGRHRLAGRGVPHDAARLLGAARSTSTATRFCRARRRRRCARSRRC